MARSDGARPHGLKGAAKKINRTGDPGRPHDPAPLGTFAACLGRHLLQLCIGDPEVVTVTPEKLEGSRKLLLETR